MKVLHIDLITTDANIVQVNYFWDSPKQVISYPILSSQLIAGLKRLNYTEDHAKIGQILYSWLNGEKNNLAKEIDRHRNRGMVLAISTGQNLAKLAWESLHDGHKFLVAYSPPILPVRWIKANNKLTSLDEPSKGSLKILINISSPQGIQPEIDINSLTVRLQQEPLHITESGSFAELCESQQTHHYDLLHLIGQTTIQNEQPYLITETELGEPEYVSIKQLIKGLGEKLPTIVFLSGCWSGYKGSQNSFSLLAEELVNLGFVQAVLTWGQPTEATETTTAIIYLYQELGKGKTLIESLALTYQMLLKTQARDWTSLHLYVKESIPGQIASLPGKMTPRVEPLLSRRSLQKCLRILNNSITTQSELGILIQSSSSKVREDIINILSPTTHKQIIWIRQITTDIFLSKLGIIRDTSKELKYQLRDVFRELNTTPLLLLFTEFEWNLDHKEGKLLLKIEVAELFKALTWAISESSLSHRIIITSCYDFEPLRFFYLIRKEGNIEEANQEIEPSIQSIMTNCLVYKVPVPIEALEVVCQSITNYQQELNKAIKLGYIEITNLENKVYKVSSILPQIYPNLRPNETGEDYYQLCQKASVKLHQIWAKQANEDEEKWSEIFRLSLADKRSTTRFREGFMIMLAVQYNSQADLAYERELRKYKDELSSDENILTQLEKYLLTDEWRQADEETAWILYQIMVTKRCRGFKELYEQIPCELLLALDLLWVKYSKGKYGFSVQNKIYRTMQSHGQEIWSQFGDIIGWKSAEEWLEYERLFENIDSVEGNLPALYSTGAYTGGWGKVGGGLGWSQEWVLGRRISSLMSRLSKCKIDDG